MKQEGHRFRRGGWKERPRNLEVKLRFAANWEGELPENLGGYLLERKAREVAKRQAQEGLLAGEQIEADSLCQIAPPVELVAEIPRGDETRVSTYYTIPDIIVHLEPRGWAFVTDSAWYELKLASGRVVLVQAIYVSQGRPGEKNILNLETLAALRVRTGVEEED